MASFASDSAGELVVLLVCNGMEAGNLCAVIEALQASSKDCGTHKRRELYWAAYGGFLKHLSGVEGDVAALLSYRAPAEGGGEEGATELVALTKRQRHMLQQGGLELMGKKLKPPDDPDGRSWAICYGEDDAARALDDLTAAEPCVWATAASVYVGTRLKRRLCKHLSAPWKTPKELEAGLQALAPALESVSVDWNAHAPPRLLGYNVLLAGPGWSAPLLAALPALGVVGHSASASPGDVYDAFLTRRSRHLVGEAERLLDTMCADVGRGETKPLVYAASMKEAAVARRMSLMRRVYVHESRCAFIANARSDGEVELFVVSGDIEGTRFAEFGGIVFELFYRADLSTFMA